MISRKYEYLIMALVLAVSAILNIMAIDFAPLSDSISTKYFMVMVKGRIAY